MKRIDRKKYEAEIRKEYFDLYRELWNTGKLNVRVELKKHVYKIPHLTENQKDHLWEDITGCH